MNTSINVYGTSLYSLAKDEGLCEIFIDELSALSDILSENSEYTDILDCGAVSSTEKFHLVDEAFSGKIHVYILNFIKILSQKRLMHEFKTCKKEFEKQYNHDNGIEEITVTTALPLDSGRREKLLKKLSDEYGKKFVPHFEVHPEILGGMVISFENSELDASIKAKLNELKKAIS